jgi:Zn-dependent peptidase ImmA (M78 family)/DNA-binding XRE family transcriptional regulator
MFRNPQRLTLRLKGVPEQAQTRFFNPNRMHLARMRKGLSKTEFARKIGVDLRTISAYSAAQYSPAEDTLRKIEAVTRFPRDFFYGDDVEIPERSIASFRALTKMSACQRDMALSQGAIALLLNRWLEEKFELPKLNLPDLSHEPNPEAAAITLRHHWGLGEAPIRNMIHLLEDNGARVFSLAINAREVDAFSMWKGTTPFVFLNTQKSSEHSRHDAAHELGHLILHKHGAPQGRQAEMEADAFASNFLMPRSSVLAHATKFPTLSSLIQLKTIWTTSVASLNYRLHVVGMLTDWQYRILCIQIARRGFRLREPNGASRESSQILPKIFAALHAEGMTRSQISKELFVPQPEIEELLFGLAISSIEGGGKSVPGNGSAKLGLVN